MKHLNRRSGYPGIVASITAVTLASLQFSSAETIVVTTSKVWSDVSQNPLGINLDYLMDDDTGRSRSISTANAINSMGVNFVRYPGGEKSDNHLWSKAPFNGPNITAARPNAFPASDPRFFTERTEREQQPA